MLKNAVRLACLVFVAAASFVEAQPVQRDPLMLVVNREPQVLSVFKVNGPSLTLVKTIPIGKGGREITLMPDGKRAYISNIADSSITLVDLQALSVVTTITDPAIASPDGGTVSADGKKVYITSAGKDSVVVISPVTHKVLKSIPTKGTAARRLIISPDGKKMYVGHNKSSHLSVIDLATEQVVSTIQVGNECRGGFAYTNDGKLLLNASVEDDVMYHIDAATGKVLRNVGTVFSPQRIIVTPKGLTLVLCGGNGKVVEIIKDLQLHDSIKTVPVGTAAWCLTTNPEGTIAYVSNYTDGTITVIDVDGAKVLATVPVGKDPNGIAYLK